MSDLNDENVSPDSQPEQETTRKGTIFYYFNKKDALDEEDPIEESESQPSSSDHRQPELQQQPRSLQTHQSHFFRYVRQRELGTRPCCWSGAALHHHHTIGYTEVNRLNLKRRGVTTLHRTIGGMEANADYMNQIRASNFVTAAEFDPHGQLLLTGDNQGIIAVHDAASIITNAHGLSHPDTLAPHVSICGSNRGVQSVGWNPVHDVEVSVSNVGRGEVQLYDLEYTRGEAKHIFKTSPSAGGVGVFDPGFFGTSPTSHHSGYTMAAGGPNGRVYLWDKRANVGSQCMPATVLQSSQSGPPVVSVQLAERDGLVIAASSNGEVKFWDVRGGSGGALRFGGVVCPHPLLGSIRIDSALHAVPGLADTRSGNIPDCLLRSVQLDPVDPRRLAFHLSCGWSGVLDLYTRDISHLHTPERQDEIEGMGRDTSGVRRTACWSRDGNRFCVPGLQALHLVDFSPATKSGCCVSLFEEAAAKKASAAVQQAVRGGSEGDGGADVAMQDQEEDSSTDGSGSNTNSGRLPGSVTVPLTNFIACAAAHPYEDVIIAGSYNDEVAVIAQR